jgi:hypothetical protein
VLIIGKNLAETQGRKNTRAACVARTARQSYQGKNSKDSQHYEGSSFPVANLLSTIIVFPSGRLKGFLKKTEKGIFQASRTVPLLVPLLSRRSAAGTAYSKIL